MSNDTSSIGRITLDRIYGQPIKQGIKVDNALDVVKINNIHFWPFWSGASEVKTYQLNNGTALISFRNDNPFYSNIFCLQYKNGIRFSRSTIPQLPGVDPNIWGITSKFKIVNADLDFCAVPFSIDGDNTTGQICDFSCQGPDAGDPNDAGIKLKGTGIHLQATNVHVTNFEHNAVRVEGTGTHLLIDNVWLNAWNRVQRGFPGIEVLDGAIGFVGGARVFSNGNSGPDMSGNIQLATLDALLVN